MEIKDEDSLAIYGLAKEVIDKQIELDPISPKEVIEAHKEIDNQNLEEEYVEFEIELEDHVYELLRKRANEEESTPEKMIVKILEDIISKEKE